MKFTTSENRKKKCVKNSRLQTILEFLRCTKIKKFLEAFLKILEAFKIETFDCKEKKPYV